MVDVNVNRAREGLRVCEEIARFVLENPSLTRASQRLRYDLTSAAQVSFLGPLVEARNARRDLGHPSRRGKSRLHKNLKALVSANAKRIQESLRVLEEFSRMKSPSLARTFAGLRFKAYSLEQDLLSGLSALRHR